MIVPYLAGKACVKMKSTTTIFPLLLLIGLSFFSCTTEEATLINWSKEFVADGLEVDDTEREPVRDDYFSVQTNGDTITVTALMLDHCVDEPVGTIECKGEKLYVTTRNTMAAEQYCPIYYKYTYVIYNPDRINYEVSYK